MAALLIVAAFAFLGTPQGNDLAFTRFDYGDFDRGSLLTATVTLRRGVTEVALVGVVHIADPAYYRELQRDLDSYDHVFYELVTDSTPQTLSSLSALQLAAGQILDLAFQIKSINYQAPNLIHSDLTWPQVVKILGHDPLPRAPDAVLEQILGPVLEGAKQAKDHFDENPHVRRSIKVFLGQLLGDIPAVLAQLNVDREGDGEDVLVSVRNRRALEVLTPHLEGNRRLALFWGAAHMPDFARRLERLGFTVVEARWHLAWRIGDIPEKRWF